jgi:hypothetical protein
MIFRRFTWNAFCRYLLFPMSILLLLSGCNLKGGSNTPTPTPTPILLEVVTSQELTCNPLLYDFFSAKSLVLATDRLIYDQAEAYQITTFVDSQGSDLVGDEWNRNVPPTPPATLKYITGSPPSSLTGLDSYDSTFCVVSLTVSNHSREILQIPQVRLRYEDNTEPNTQRLNLINVCSIGKRLFQEGNECPQNGAGSGDGYVVSFTIGRGAVNKIYFDKPRKYAGTPEQVPAIPTLRPGDVAKLDMQISVKNYTSGLLVSAVPEFVVTSSNETQILTLTQLNMDIAIAAPQNVSCYALHGTTFVEQNPQIQSGSWCV